MYAITIRMLRGVLPSLILVAGLAALAGAGTAGAAPPGPALSFSQWPGGITVNVTDKSGITSWCTYSAEWFSTPFLLVANATYPVVIPFSAPDNRVWNVSVNCDNGASTRTTYNYVPTGTVTEPDVEEPVEDTVEDPVTPCPPGQTRVGGACTYPPCPYTGQYRDVADGQCKCGAGRSTNPDGSCGAYVGAPAPPGLEGLGQPPRRSTSFRKRRRQRPPPIRSAT